MRRAILAAENEGEPTERLLWHGTPVPHVITTEGFDPRVCNLQGMFGAGVYFADKSTKSVRYAGACARPLVNRHCRATSGATHRVAVAPSFGLRKPRETRGTRSCAAHRARARVTILTSIQRLLS